MVQGRQLITPEIMQAKWPAQWAQFQQTVFPGLNQLLRRVDARGTTDLSEHEEDCRNQAYVDQALCCVLLVDSAFHFYDFMGSDCWKELGIFSDPTSEWMQWHHDQFAPWIRQLQHDAERAHACIREARGGRTVLDQARTNLNIEQASATDACHILQEIVRLMDSSSSSVFGMPVMQKQPEPILPLPKVHRLSVSPTTLPAPRPSDPYGTCGRTD